MSEAAPNALRWSVPARWYCAFAQVPTFQSSTIATSASTVNQAMLVWPNGSTTKAASSGPRADPVLPPTWKNDCAKP